MRKHCIQGYARALLMSFIIGMSMTLSAMPTAEEIAAAEPLVQEVMKAETEALRRGKKTREQVGDAAVALAKEAQALAEKYILLTGAFDYYMRCGSYDKAASALGAVRKAVPDWKGSDEFALIEKAMRSVSFGKGGPVRERYEELKERQQYAIRLKKALAQAQAKPTDKKLQFQVAAYYAALDRWPQALDAFIAGSSPACAAAAKLEKESAPPAKTADAWWSALDVKPDFLSSAIRTHAAALYTKALADPTFAGLQKVQAERRIKETQSATIQINDPTVETVASGKNTAKSYIQNGLVAQWDALENVGYGVHGDSPPEWVNLRGSKNIVLTKSASFTANALVCDGKGFAGSIKDFLPSSKIVSADIVFEINLVHGNSCLFSTGTHREYYDRCFGIVGGGGKFLFSNYILGGVTKGRHCCHLNFLTGSYSLDGVNGVSNSKGTLDASPNRGYEFYIGGFKDSAINCKIYAIRFYGRKLTDEEIQKNYVVDKARFVF